MSYTGSGGIHQALTMDRETIKRLLAFPSDTNIIWKSHDDSIAQRSALDEARQQKTGGSSGRRQTIHEDSEREAKGKAAS